MPARRTPLPESVLSRRRELGKRIAAGRRKAGLSQDQLAERIGMERRSVQRYESGDRDPRFTDLVLISEAIGVPLPDLVR
ncbi:helix-turn-helix domain-containing protein [Streptomyces sp. 2RAF24]|uniref:helix-turn-helix domain-containing protein n=1 Tax=Streptomyces sp. 2RAF24 TaxID=3232997 RepID=UPI003F94752C